MGTRKLNTNVHLLDEQGQPHQFGPDDDVPAWAVAAITNDSVWATDNTNGDDDAADDDGDDTPAPPRRGRPPKDRTPDQGE